MIQLIRTLGQNVFIQNSLDDRCVKEKPKPAIWASVSNMRIGISGSPGTGKRSVGTELSRQSGLEFMSLNDFAIKKRTGKWVNGEFCVDSNALRRVLTDMRGKIVSGHILPYVVPSNRLDFVAVLRCSPNELRKRYMSRGYSREKILENVEAEFLDLVSFKCLETYGIEKVAEFDTTKMRSSTIARRILNTLAGKLRRSYGIGMWSMKASKSPKDLRRVLEMTRARERD